MTKVWRQMYWEVLPVALRKFDASIKWRQRHRLYWYRTRFFQDKEYASTSHSGRSLAGLSATGSQESPAAPGAKIAGALFPT